MSQSMSCEFLAKQGVPCPAAKRICDLVIITADVDSRLAGLNKCNRTARRTISGVARWLLANRLAVGA